MDVCFNLNVLFHLYIFFIILLVLLEINELFNEWHVQMFQRLIVTMKISHYVLCNVQIFVTRSLSILPLQYTGHWTLDTCNNNSEKRRG